MSERLETLPLKSIRLDGGTQTRASLTPSVVSEYAEAMLAGEVFPPVCVCFDGEEYWLWDGFHRYHGATIAGLGCISAAIRPGMKRDALLLAVGANARHGLRRSNEDKRRVVLTLLQDEEWSRWSDREIARCAGVSQPFVSSLRGNLSDNRYQMDRARTVQRGGRAYTMDTTRIGTSAAKLTEDEAARLSELEACIAAEAINAITRDVQEALREIRSKFHPDPAAFAVYLAERWPGWDQFFVELADGTALSDVRSVPISDIEIGERRREDLGDLAGLAQSIAEDGLLHPILIDNKRRLVAGYRRLLACRDYLAWDEIAANNLGDLTDEEMDEIGLAENMWKDYTPAELAK